MQLPTERDGQRGCFRIAQAEAVGWSRFSLRRAAAAGRLVLVRPGVYAEAEAFSALDGRELHVARIVGEQLGMGSHWYAARRSAAVVFDLPLVGQDPAVPQLLAPRERVRGQQTSRHRRRSLLPAADRRILDGVCVVSAGRMFADLARAESLRNAVVVGDALLGRGYPRELLHQSLAGMGHWPGVVAAREALAFADGLSESPLESISRVAFRELGLPPPELQVEVWCGSELVARVDHLWRVHNTIGEADGLGKYGDDSQSVHAALRAEKRRTERLEDLGFEVVRWGWAEAWRPRGVLDAKLLRAFDRGRHQQLDPHVRLVPTAVEHRVARAG